jgi:hypothetical protein
VMLRRGIPENVVLCPGTRLRLKATSQPIMFVTM